MTPTLEQLEPHIILRAVVGSTVHGLSLEGTDDRDEMGICIEPIESHLVLGQPFEQLIHRTAAIREHDINAKSQPGDLDLTVFSLRKFCSLAAAGNPTVLLMFYSPDIIKMNSLGSHLVDLAPKFASKEAGKRFMGYMHGQRLRLIGEKGQKRVRRPDLEALHGYDTKYAMHVLRLGFQGYEFVLTGKLKLPMTGDIKDYLMSVRKGQVPLEDVLKEAERLEKDISLAMEISSLPDHPDRPYIEEWLQEIYLNWWKANQTHWFLKSPDSLRFSARKPNLTNTPKDGPSDFNSVLAGSKE